MFTSKTYTTAQINASFKANRAATVAFTERKAKDGKVYKGNTIYLDTTWTVGEDKPCQCAIYARDVRIVRGIEDPNDPNKKFQIDKKEDSKEVVVGISHNHSGGYGELVRAFNDERDSRLDVEFPQWKKEKKNPMFSERYPDTAHKDFAGKPYNDPVDNTKHDYRSNLAFDFSSWGSESYIPMEKRGKPKCIVWDFRTGRLDPTTNRIVYDMLLVDGKPVNETNAWKVFKSGAIFEEIYVTINNTSKSKFGIATKQLVSEAVISPREEIRTGDINRIDNNDLLARIAAAQKAKEAAAKSAELAAAALATANSSTDTSTSTTSTSTTSTSTSTTATSDQPEIKIPDIDPKLRNVLDKIV